MLQPRLFKTCFRKCGEFERAEGIPVRLDEFRRLCNHVSAVSKTLGPLSTKATWNANANAESFSALAASRFENGDFKGASSLYRTCIDIQPSNKVYHFALGAAEEASGDVEKAAAAYEMALEIDLKWRHPMDGLVRCLEAMHKERTRKGLLGKFLLFLTHIYRRKLLPMSFRSTSVTLSLRRIRASSPALSCTGEARKRSRRKSYMH